MWRPWLALWRLLGCFALACFLFLFLGLALRQARESGWGLDHPLPPAEAPASQIPFLGITVDLLGVEPASRQADLSRLRATGFDWVRQRFAWAQIEPEPAHLAWAESDELLTAIDKAGLVPVAVLDGSPAWARAPVDVGAYENALAPPADPQDFARFAGQFAARYGRQVRFYQLWDEPNIAPHWGNRHIEPVEYAQLLRAAAVAIRQADPDAVILLAALAPTADRGHTAIDEVYFLQRLYAAGAAPFFDAVAVQSFGFGEAPEDGRERLAVLNLQRAKLIRRAMLAAGDGETPIWLVRYGWNTRQDSPWGTVTPADQVDFAGQTLRIAWQWPWLAAAGWMVDRPSASTDDPLWGYALRAELAQTLASWRSPAGGRMQPGGQGADPWAVWPLAILAALVVLWRAWAATTLLPWRRWRSLWLAQPWPLRALGWLAVAVLYYFASWPPLIFFSWLAAALLVAAEPLAGLLLAAVLLPFYYQHKELYLVDYSWTIAPAEAVALCLLPVLGYQLWLTRRRRGWPLTATDRLALLWLAINLAAVFTVWQWPAYGQGLRDVVIVPLVLYLAVRLLVTSQAQQEQIALALLLGGLLAAVGGLVTWWRGEGVVADGLLRLVGFSYSPNHTALYLERTLLLGAGLTLAWPRPVWRWGLAGATAIVGVALLLTVSRGAWFLGLPVALGMAGWLVQRRVGGRGTMRLVKQRPVRFWLGLLLVLSLLAVVVLLLLPAISARLHNSETVSSRLRIWQATFALWRDYPLFGVGVGGFFWRYPAFLIGSISEPNILHPHNVWLEFAAIWGLSGLLWLGALLVIVVRQSRCWAWAPVGRDFWLALGLAAGLAAGFAHAQVDTLFVLADLAAWNWLALALLDSIRKFLCATKPAREGK